MNMLAAFLLSAYAPEWIKQSIEDCPHDCPLHNHHDGCPSCAEADDSDEKEGPVMTDDDNNTQERGRPFEAEAKKRAKFDGGSVLVCHAVENDKTWVFLELHADPTTTSRDKAVAWARLTPGLAREVADNLRASADDVEEPK